MKKYRLKVKPSIKKEVLERDHGMCVYCHERATEVDHILPYSWSVDNDLSNLVACCRDCNSIAGDKIFPSLQKKADYIREQRETLKWRRKLAKRLVAFCTNCGINIYPGMNGDTNILCSQCANPTRKQKVKSTKKPKAIDRNTLPDIPSVSVCLDAKQEQLVQDQLSQKEAISISPRQLIETTLKELEREIQGHRENENITWQKIADLYYPGVSKSTLWLIANRGYEPKDPKIRVKLGLATKIMTPVCHVHGIVHREKCPVRIKKYKDLLEIPVKELRWMIDNRKEMT